MNQIINTLVKKGIQLSVIEGQLKIQLGKATLSESETSELRTHKEDIIHFLQDNRVASLSNAQERLWFLDQLGDGGQYHVLGLVKVDGQLDTHALKRTIDKVIARHEGLRTSFQSLDGKAVQLIKPVINLSIEHADISHLSGSQLSIEQQKLTQHFVQSPFDLKKAPLFRVILIKRSNEMHVLGICMHHIISDGWSIGILIRELTAIYNEEVGGVKANLKPLEIQYSDYASWQQLVLSEEKMTEELTYWKDQIQGYSDLDLITDFQRPAQLSGDGGHSYFKLKNETVAQLKKEFLSERVTLYTAFMTGVYLLLQKYTAQSDFCIGMPVSNRTSQDLEDIVGFFVSTLVLKIKNGDRASGTKDLIREVNKTIVEAQDRKNLPFEKLVEEIKPARNMSRTPIFQVLVNYVNTPVQALKFGDCKLEVMDSNYNSAKFDLTFNFNEIETGELVITIEYSTDLFRESTIDKMGENLLTIMQKLGEPKNIPLNEVGLVSHEELELMQSWNQTSFGCPNSCLHELVEQQAIKNPQSLAVEFENQSLNYKELDVKSSDVAAYLQSKGVKPNTLVSICMEPSLNMIVGILGILKSGGAYLPLAPEHPDDRLKYMLEDSSVGLLLGQRIHNEKLSSLTTDIDIDLVLIEDITSIDETYKLKRLVTPKDMAYVIYTSGTTGRPKGVKVSHQSIVNETRYYAQNFNFSVQDKQLVLANYIFDASVEQIFVPLISGSTAVLITKETQMDTKQLENILNDKEITHFQSTPSLIQTITPQAYTKLARVCSGGEPCPTGLAEKWDPFVDFYNKYGPTEATVNASFYAYNVSDINSGILPIGKPIGNTKLYVLDSHKQPVPIGMKGELYIGGIAVSLGYLNREELTNEKFVKSPFKDSSLLYRTGDIVRWRTDGNVEFLGRKDGQVKVRGYRIELGEIENVLSEYTLVKHNAIIARQHQGNTQLIAYYSSSETDDLTEKLKGYLQNKLPEYMIPVAFVQLDKLPLTSNGKIDRKALENLELTLQSNEEYVAPENEIEHHLVAIWKEVLGLETIGVNDDFFALGGHSLLATQIISRINKELEIDIPLMKLFNGPTIKKLAVVVMASEHYEAQNVLTDFEEGSSELTI